MGDLLASVHRVRSYDMKPLDGWHQRFEHADNGVGDVQRLEGFGIHIRVARVHNRLLRWPPLVAAMRRS